MAGSREEGTKESPLILLDTEVAVFRLFKGAQLKAFERTMHGKELCISFMVATELLLRGALRMKRDELEIYCDELHEDFTVVPCSRSLCVTYAILSREAQGRGQHVDPTRLWTAAVAVEHQIPILTANGTPYRNLCPRNLILEPQR